MHLEKTREPAGRTANSLEADWQASKSFPQDSDIRGDAQRRLALKLAAGAGLSIAVASVLVVVALGDGRVN